MTEMTDAAANFVFIAIGGFLAYMLIAVTTLGYTSKIELKKDQDDSAVWWLFLGLLWPVGIWFWFSWLAWRKITRRN